MTHQMPPGAQIAFAKDWLERQNIESQTIDIAAHIDPSLSYEENIKNLKRQFGLGGGRSRQQAARGLTATECDVAIGNFDAGFNGMVARDACRCGHPDACETLERKRATKAAAPKLKTVEDIDRWMKEKSKEYGSKNEFMCSSEYKKMYPKIKAIYDRAKKQKIEERKQVTITRNPYETGYALKYANMENAYVGGGGPMGMGMDIAKFDTVDNAHKEAKRLGFTVMSSLSPPLAPPSKDYTPTATWEQFVKVNARQIATHNKGIHKWATGIKDKKKREKLYKREVREYKIQLTDIWHKTKPAATTRAEAELAKTARERGKGKSIGKLPPRISPTLDEENELLHASEQRWVLQQEAAWEAEQAQKAAAKRQPAARTAKKPKAKKTAAKPKPKVTRKKSAAAAPKPKVTPKKTKAKKTAATPKLTAAQREYLAIQGFVMVKRGGKYIKITK